MLLVLSTITLLSAGIVFLLFFCLHRVVYYVILLLHQLYACILQQVTFLIPWGVFYDIFPSTAKILLSDYHPLYYFNYHWMNSYNISPIKASDTTDPTCDTNCNMWDMWGGFNSLQYENKLVIIDAIKINFIKHQ